MKTPLQQIWELFEQARNHGMILSKKKTRIVEKVKFASHIISKDGILPDPQKTAAISSFPTPQNLTQLWSFLASFHPDLAILTAPLQSLLHKNVQWLWLPEHEFPFQKVRSTVTSSCVNHHFDPKFPTFLILMPLVTMTLGMPYFNVMDMKTDPTLSNVVLEVSQKLRAGMPLLSWNAWPFNGPCPTAIIT